MRRDTFALSLLFVFVIPFSLAISMGYYIDFERGCKNDKECPSNSTCKAGTCETFTGCGKNAKVNNDLDSQYVSRAQARIELTQARARQRSARRRWSRTRTSYDREEYNEARKEYKVKWRQYLRSLRSRGRSRRSVCEPGARCNYVKGQCYYPVQLHSSWVYLHPGYYHYRARVSRYASRPRNRYRKGSRYGRTRRSRYRSAGSRYRSSGFRSFRGGGLGFGK